MANARTVRLDWYGERVRAAIEEAGDPALFEMGQIMLKNAKGRINRRSGRTAKSGYVATKSKSTYKKKPWRRREVRPTEGVVVAFSALNAHILERTGAQAHRIPSKKKKKTTMTVHGRGLRASVNHPGMKAKPFLRPALDSTKSEMVTKFVREVRKDLESGS